jgi:hypothetical protein
VLSGKLHGLGGFRSCDIVLALLVLMDSSLSGRSVHARSDAGVVRGPKVWRSTLQSLLLECVSCQ